MKDVRRFFNEKHGGHYKIYNLCLEKTYDIKNFEQVNNDYKFEDNTPPPFHFILTFCRDMVISYYNKLG